MPQIGENPGQSLRLCSPNVRVLGSQDGHFLFAERQNNQNLGYPAMPIQGSGLRARFHVPASRSYRTIVSTLFSSIPNIL